MIIREARIDDRLIHGQVVTKWLQQAQAKAILVADNAAAQDSFQQSMLKMATPAGIQLIIKSLEDSAALVNRDISQVNVLLIVRDPQSARNLGELGLKPKHWTVGNITGRQSELERKTVLKYVLPTQMDADDLKAISEMGISLAAQSVPNEKRYDIMELLKKSGFYA